MICPDCKGHGSGQGFASYDDGSCRFGTFDCFRCKGSGAIPDEHQAWIEAGNARRTERIARDVSLREEAIRLGISTVELSELERGMRAPSPTPDGK